MKMKKVLVTLSKDEFRALLFRHAEQDAEKWLPELRWMLGPEDVAFIEQLRSGGQSV